MTDVINRQSAVEIESETYAAFANQMVAVLTEDNNLKPVIAFVGDDEMRRLNLEFRGKDSTTDVLSFAFDEESFEEADSLGDIVISAEQAVKQALENGLEIELEIKQLVLHGALHLCGFDHETDNGEMNAREIELREILNIA